MTQDYYGTKRVVAWEQNDPSIRDGAPPRPGYAVKYADGYISWSPKAVFDAAYQPLDALSFGHALVALKAGHRVARGGWNGKGMWLLFIPRSHWETTRFTEGLEDLPWIGMKTADNKFVPWLASQTDMLADDWCIVDG